MGYEKLNYNNEISHQASVEVKDATPLKQSATIKQQGYKRLYSIPEAAHYLGRSSWSVRRLVWAGELPCVRGGRRVHLDVRDMDAFIEQHKERG